MSLPENMRGTVAASEKLGGASLLDTKFALYMHGSYGNADLAPGEISRLKHAFFTGMAFYQGDLMEVEDEDSPEVDRYMETLTGEIEEFCRRDLVLSAAPKNGRA